MNKPVANVSFSAFYKEIILIFNGMSDREKRNFREEIAKYYKQNNEPLQRWKKTITDLIGKSKTRISWSSDFLSDLRQGKADITRTIAFYYYIHHLIHDLTFADAVDKVVFSREPEAERTYASVHGKPVFQMPETAASVDEMLWKSATRQWELTHQDTQPVNGLLASLSIELTQSGDTRQPVALLAQVHIRPAYDLESGVELYFKAVDIVVECNQRFPSKIHYSASDDKFKDCKNGQFRVDGTNSYPYITLSNNEFGLDGNYLSDTLLLVHPNCQNCELDAALRARIIHSNAVFPDDLEIGSGMKREIIKRMVQKSVLPPPDVSGHVTLHEVKYDICAIESKLR